MWYLYKCTLPPPYPLRTRSPLNRSNMCIWIICNRNETLVLYIVTNNRKVIANRIDKLFMEFQNDFNTNKQRLASDGVWRNLTNLTKCIFDYKKQCKTNGFVTLETYFVRFVRFRQISSDDNRCRLCLNRVESRCILTQLYLCSFLKICMWIATTAAPTSRSFTGPPVGPDLMQSHN